MRLKIKQTFISRHNSNFFSDKLVLTSVTPASSAPVLQTPKATSSTLYFDSLTVNAGNGGFLHCIQMDTSVNAANQVVSVGADIAFDADFFFQAGDGIRDRDVTGVQTCALPILAARASGTSAPMSSVVTVRSPAKSASFSISTAMRAISAPRASTKRSSASGSMRKPA